MSGQTTAEVIHSAWEKAPTEWAGWREGAPVRVTPWIDTPAINTLAHTADPVHMPLEAIEFRREVGALYGRPAWRIRGTWRGETVTVARGRF